MKNIDKLASTMSIIGLIVSISSLGFIGFDELFHATFLKDISMGVFGSIIGAVAAMYTLRLNAKAKSPSVFISYHHSNKDIARRITNELKGISDHIWFDDQEIRIGDSIKEKIESGLKNSDFFLIVLSDAANKSHWAELELSKAIKLGKIVLPVKIDSSEPPESIRDIAYADLSKSFDSGMSSLKRAFLAQAHNKIALKRA